MSITPCVLNFSGNDSAGLAGLAMDVRTQRAMNTHSLSVITANTAQNNQGVIAINPTEKNSFESQLTAVADLPIRVIKLGLVANAQQLSLIHEFVQTHNYSLVADTVFASSSGATFSSFDYVEQFKETILPISQLITPNILEAEQLSGIAIQSTDEMVLAANMLCTLGAKAVLIKGGHFPQSTSPWVQDYFTDGHTSFWLASEKINTTNTRGTGCALASAIASALALGYSLYDSVVIGKMAINQGLRQSYSVEKAYGPVNVTCFPDNPLDLPLLSDTPLTDTIPDVFPECNQPKKMGLYPVVERASWVERLAKAGVTTIQLRVKDLQGEALVSEIRQAIQYARHYEMRLFINDYWQLAIQENAYGVHLGQEDLATADIEAIRKAGLRLGISTHCHYEVARAHRYRPSYIACGPVYHTTTKDMPWVPHGLEGLRYWRHVLRYPLVAIGGINAKRIQPVAKTGVDSIAMITAITLSHNPEKTTENFLEVCQSL